MGSGRGRKRARDRQTDRQRQTCTYKHARTIQTRTRACVRAHTARAARPASQPVGRRVHQRSSRTATHICSSIAALQPHLHPIVAALVAALQPHCHCHPLPSSNSLLPRSNSGLQFVVLCVVTYKDVMAGGGGCGYLGSRGERHGDRGRGRWRHCGCGRMADDCADQPAARVGTPCCCCHRFVGQSLWAVGRLSSNPLQALL
jgi:hypothetical protein